jgi:hypothetical protein
MKEQIAPLEIPMQTKYSVFLVLFAVLPVCAAQPRCTDTPVTVTLEFIYTDPHTSASLRSAIYSDGTSLNNPPYVHGVDGVEAVINCSSKDLVLNLSSSSRFLGFNFSGVLWTNNTPSWVGNVALNPFYGKASITVRNIMYGYNPLSDYDFTTRFGSMMPGPDKKTYYPRMVNPSSQAITTTPEASANYPAAPFNTSFVNVHHTANPESWIIYADAAVMGSTTSGAEATHVLSLLESSKNTYVNRGQFRMPFYLVVKRK